MAFLFKKETVKETGIKPSQTRISPLLQKDSAAAATAQTFDFDVPRNKFIWAILISIGEDTTATGGQGTLADDLIDIQLIGNGNKYMKVMTAPMAKALSIVNEEPQNTGYYKVYLKDPKLGITRPLPAWVFTSLILRLVDNAPAASNYHHIRVSIIESDSENEDLSHHPVLIEKYMSWKKFGTNTGWQTYEHERAYTVLGYLYCIDDNATLSDTAFDKLKIIGINPSGEDRLAEEIYITHLKELNYHMFRTAMPTGCVMAEFLNGYDTSKYTSLTSYLNIASAGTNVGVRVLERYVLS